MEAGSIKVVVDARELEAAHGESTTKYAGTVKLRIGEGDWLEYECPEWETDRTEGWADWVSDQIKVQITWVPGWLFDSAYTEAQVYTCDGELTEWLIEWTAQDPDIGGTEITIAQVFDVMKAAQDTVERCVKDLKAIIERSYAPGEYVDTESMLLIGKAISVLEGVVLFADDEDDDLADGDDPADDE